MRENPFFHEIPATGDRFADRADELRIVRRALLQPGRRLMLYGERRQGKTSLLLRARDLIRRGSGRSIVVYADLSAANAPDKVGTQILSAATEALGRDPTRRILDLVEHIRLKLQIDHNPATGAPVPAIELGFAATGDPDSLATVTEVLDGIDRYAAKSGTPIGVILDEWQTLWRMASDADVAEWSLRAAIQHHEHVSYVLAGSDRSLAGRLADVDRAFYQMFEPVHVGDIDAGFMIRWLAARFGSVGVECEGGAEEIVRLAGPRSGDIVRLASACFELGVPVLTPEAVRTAMERTAHRIAPWLSERWQGLTTLQQNTLHAIVDDAPQLTSADTLRRYRLTTSATVTYSIRALIERDIVRRDPGRASGYRISDPFFGAWMRRSLGPAAG